MGEEIGVAAQQIYHQWINEQKETYKNSCNKLLDYLYDERFKDVGSSFVKTFLVGKKSPEDIIKARFKGFNNDFAAMFEEQVVFIIADEELRQLMRTILSKILLPPYLAFWEKYKEIPFTKNTEKYLKYSPEVVEALCNFFFEGQLKEKSSISNYVATFQSLASSNADFVDEE